MISRRSILRAAPLLFAAPAIVRISSLMPVRALPPQYWGDLLIVEDVAAISWECSYGAVNVDPRFFERLEQMACVSYEAVSADSSFFEKLEDVR